MSDCKCDFGLGQWSCTCGELAREKSATRPPNDGRVDLNKRGWHAWFSPSINAKKLHVNFYCDKDGEEIEITEVCREPERPKRTGYEDLQYRGIVVKHSRRIRNPHRDMIPF